MNRFKVFMLALLAMIVPTIAAAQISVGDAVAEIEGAGTAIGTVGAALVGVAAIYMAWRWVKGFVKGG